MGERVMLVAGVARRVVGLSPRATRREAVDSLRKEQESPPLARVTVADVPSRAARVRASCWLGRVRRTSLRGPFSASGTRTRRCRLLSDREPPERPRWGRPPRWRRAHPDLRVLRHFLRPRLRRRRPPPRRRPLSRRGCLHRCHRRLLRSSPPRLPRQPSPRSRSFRPRRLPHVHSPRPPRARRCGRACTRRSGRTGMGICW